MVYSARQMAALQPGSPMPTLLGYYLSMLGLNEKAQQAYWEGLNIDPANQYIIYNLAELYRSNGQQQAALHVLNQAILNSKKPAILYKAKGDLLQEWGYTGMAACNYELALEKLGDRHRGFRQEILHRLAHCYQSSGETEASLETWQQALALEPNDAEALFHLTVLYY